MERIARILANRKPARRFVESATLDAPGASDRNRKVRSELDAIEQRAETRIARNTAKAREDKKTRE